MNQAIKRIFLAHANLITVVLLIAAQLLFFLLFSPPDAKIDEYIHMEQIRWFQRGDFNVFPLLTTFPTFHHIYAAIADLFGIKGLVGYRYISLFFAMCLMAVFYLTVRLVNPEKAVIKTLQFSFIPILFPFLPLLYTDVFALLMLMLALYFHLREINFLALFFAAIAVLVRQPNLVWFCFFPTIIYFQSNPLVSLKSLLSGLKKIDVWIFVFLAFILFFIANGGVALGDKLKHPISFNITNLYFLLLLFFFMFAPVLLSQLKQVIILVQKQRWIAVSLTIGLVVYLYTFNVSHEYNLGGTDYFIRNMLLNWMDNHLLLKVLSYVLSVYAVLAAFTIGMIQKQFHWLYLFIPLSVVAMPLIEQRYYIIGFAFWQVLRLTQSSRAEWINFVWLFLLSGIVYRGIYQGNFFL